MARMTAAEDKAIAAHDAFLSSIPDLMFELQELGEPLDGVEVCISLTREGVLMQFYIEPCTTAQYGCTTALTRDSEKYEFDNVREMLIKIKTEQDERKERAEKAKALRASLTKEQMELLREFGI